MSPRLLRLLIAVACLLGVIILTAKFVGSHQRTILFSGWLQGIGPLLYVLFAHCIVYLAGRSTRLSGAVTLLASAIILTLSVIDAALSVSVVIAIEAGQSATDVGLDLIAGPGNDAIGRAFLIGPPLLEPVGIAILHSGILPRRAFGYVGITFGTASIIWSLVQLFSSASFATRINITILQDGWVIIAAVMIAARRPGTDSQSDVHPLERSL